MKLALLDRGGVINEDSPNHTKSVNEWLPYAGSIEAIARLKRHGVKVAICTGVFDCLADAVDNLIGNIRR